MAIVRLSHECLKLPATRLFVQLLVRAEVKETITSPRMWGTDGAYASIQFFAVDLLQVEIS